MHRPWFPVHMWLNVVFVNDFCHMSDLKVLMEMACWVLVGIVIHSEGKNELKDEVSLVCLGIRVVGVLRSCIGRGLKWGRLYR